MDISQYRAPGNQSGEGSPPQKPGSPQPSVAPGQQPTSSTPPNLPQQPAQSPKPPTIPTQPIPPSPKAPAFTQSARPAAGGTTTDKSEGTAPKVPEVKIRTMGSDLSAGKADVKSATPGTAAPDAKSVLPPQFEKEPVFKPETQDALGGPVIEGEKKSYTKWLWIGGGAVTVIGIGLLGYFVIFPLLFPASVPTPTEDAETAPIEELAEPVLHQSLFISPASEIVTIEIPAYDLSSIATALQNEATLPLAVGLIKEVALMANDAPASFAQYLNALAPGVSVEDAAQWFVDDFTAYLYYDAEGVWPGYAVRIAPDADRSAIQAMLAVLELSDLSTFYLASPGEMGVFQDGKVLTYPSRYAVGTQPGAAFNYAVIGDYLVLSASYSGLQASVQLLGL